MICTFSFLLFFSFVSLNAIPVRVLLGDQKQGTWSLSADKGFCLRDRTTDRELTLKGTRHTFKLTCKKDGVYVEEKKLLADNMLFEPIDGVTHFDGGKYQGAFYLQKEKGSYFLINILPIEDYIFSVLRTESWPGWPLEINKVFAIACRSYLLHQLLSSRSKDATYHIRNTNHHQTYTGLHTNTLLRQAVDETRGMFLAHQGQPILAMFDCCCGGVIPASIQGNIDFKKAPYLGRTYACHYCKTCKIFKWSVSYEVDHFIDLLQEGTHRIIHDVKDIKVVQKDKAGLVKDVSVKTPRGLLAFGAHELYKLFKEIKSYSFSISKKGKKVTLNGKGYGHHIGLCQWGAHEMVKQGFDYKKVLEFYYPKTTFMKLERQKKV
jgi:stage II sporulation protein D